MTRSVFRRAYDRMIAAREEKARGLIREYLSTQNDATLQSLGISRKDLEGKTRTTFEF